MNDGKLGEIKDINKKKLKEIICNKYPVNSTPDKELNGLNSFNGSDSRNNLKWCINKVEKKEYGVDYMLSLIDPSDCEARKKCTDFNYCEKDWVDPCK